MKALNAFEHFTICNIWTILHHLISLFLSYLCIIFFNISMIKQILNIRIDAADCRKYTNKERRSSVPSSQCKIWIFICLCSFGFDSFSMLFDDSIHRIKSHYVTIYVLFELKIHFQWFQSSQIKFTIVNCDKIKLRQNQKYIVNIGDLQVW